MSRDAHTARGTEEQRSRHRAPRRSSGRVPRTVAVLCGTALATAVGGVAGASAQSAALPPAPVDIRVADAQGHVLALVNNQRTRHGCAALTGSAQLNQLAESYSTEMGVEGFFGHVDPAGRTPWDRARVIGITGLGGENIAVGQSTPQAVMAAWMSSPRHRANILDCAYHSLGVGVYYAEGGPWWTEEFGT